MLDLDRLVAERARQLGSLTKLVPCRRLLGRTHEWAVALGLGMFVRSFFCQVEAKIVIKYCAARKNIEGSVIGVLFSIC